MGAYKEYHTRKRIFQFYEKNKQFGNKFTLNHFLAENISRSTIYRVIQRLYKSRKKVGSGLTRKKMARKKVTRLLRNFDQMGNLKNTWQDQMEYPKLMSASFLRMPKLNA